jgi:hypothetical protein
MLTKMNGWTTALLAALLGVLTPALAGPCVKETYFSGDGSSGYTLNVVMWNTDWVGERTVETRIQYEWSSSAFHDAGSSNANKYLGTATLSGAALDWDRETVTYRAFYVPAEYVRGGVTGSYNVFWYVDGEYDCTGQIRF